MQSNQQKMHYKEDGPLETVKELKEILNKNNIETTEEWQPESSVGTWSLRVVFKGTNLGANGKGVSKEYAMASAYAELFERYQNDMLGAVFNIEKQGECEFCYSHDEVLLSTKDLIAQENNSYLDMYFKTRNLNNASLDQKIEAFEAVQRMDSNLFDIEGKYLCVPFYSVKYKQITYLPKNVYRLSYGSNGMSAGNTIEEAIVQGLAEIIERYIQRSIFIDKISFPDVPKSYIKKFPYIYEMYIKLSENKKYKFFIKDCSLGGKYPVAALIIVDKETGKYGMKLGCHPDFGVAIERAFTEAAQGQDILEYSNRSFIDFYNKGIDDEMNMYNTYKVGKGQFPYQIFSNQPTYPFVEFKNVSNMSNVEIMKEWCNEFISEGHDILVRDVSYLGFPSVHIIIPGLSEMFDANDFRYRTYNTRHYVSKILMTPEKITKENSKYVIATLEFFLPSILENSIETYYGWYENGSTSLPGSDSGLGCIYLIAMCHILNENYGKAAMRIKSMINVIDSRTNDLKVKDKEILLYRALYYYCSAMDAMNDKADVKSYLRSFMRDDVCDYVFELMDDPSKVIVKQYPSYVDYKKEVNNPFEKAEKYFELREKLKKAQLNNPINQRELRKVF